MWADGRIMSELRQLADAGFHAGELAVQREAGVQAQAARLTAMLEQATLTGGIAGFLADRTFLVLTGQDEAARLWTTVVTGAQGFIAVLSETAVAIHARIPTGDPLHGLPPGQKIGMVAIEFATRRRVRVNGILAVASEELLIVDVEQAYGNCPQYIQQRLLQPCESRAGGLREVRQDATLTDENATLIRSADTFFLGTIHPGRGADASHRGGAPGFVRVDGNRRLWWPDYRGNNMFNSLGNLAVDPEAALLFLDFRTGRTVQLSGTAAVEFDHAGEAGDDDGTGRRVVFDIRCVTSARHLAVREVVHRPYPRNPALSN
jgi:predicted pyridoxine 5'-phosphate oxidase superfamily flavin-nucleotide-binding protein